MYFRERLLPGVPEELRQTLDFEDLFHAFGGKLAHWADYITDYGKNLVCLRNFLLNQSSYS